jgi:DNA-binding FrmR family transcriptional regulator
VDAYHTASSDLGDPSNNTPGGKVDSAHSDDGETTVQVDEGATGDVIKRLRRAEGQIRGVIAMLEEGRDCADVVTQLAAVSRALDRAGFKIIASGLQQCMSAAEDGEDQAVNLQQMEKLFLSLA